MKKVFFRRTHQWDSEFLSTEVITFFPAGLNIEEWRAASLLPGSEPPAFAKLHGFWLKSSEVSAQLSKQGSCPNYQTDRKFQLNLIEKVAGNTYYILHRLPNEKEANHTCSKIVFNTDNSFKYYYVDPDGVLIYYNGDWTAQPTTLTSPGRISLRFEYIDIMGSDVTGLTDLLILWSTGSFLFTTIHCKPGAFGYYEEYMYTLAKGELLYLPKFADLLQSTLVSTGTVNSRLLETIPQTCSKKG